MEMKMKSDSESSARNREAMDRFSKNVLTVSKLALAVVGELGMAARQKTLPLRQCLYVTIGFCVIRLFKIDERIFLAWGWGPFFLKNNYVFWAYHIFWLTLGFTLYGCIRLARTVKINNKLKKNLEGIGLKNVFGETPTFISDHPIDEDNRILRLNRVLVPIEEFIKKQNSIGGSLQVHIENIEEMREDGTVNIYYSTVPMPSLYKTPDIKAYKDFTFPIGRSRSRELIGDFKQSPHMLVAGESSGGKSTFLRQLFATLYVNNENCDFVMIDLKGSLEFQFFEELPRTTVCSNIKEAVKELETFKARMETRITEIKEVGAKDFEDYQRIRNLKLTSKIEHMVVPKQLSRVIIIIDEAADLFLVSEKSRSAEVRKTRTMLSELARKGRALGFHLVFSTQRPDVSAVDSQVKANLGSIVAYKIGNDASSKTILDNGRASQLPKVPGRAIWKMGGDMVEVQTPFLDVIGLEKLLEPLRSSKKKTQPEKADETTKATEVNSEVEHLSNDQSRMPAVSPKQRPGQQ